MTIIKIEPNDNGSHDNQTSSASIPLPDGYAVLPEEVGAYDTLENYPFGEITVEEVDGVPTVTGWTPLPMPEPEPEPEPAPETETPAQEPASVMDKLAAAYLEGVDEA